MKQIRLNLPVNLRVTTTKHLTTNVTTKMHINVCQHIA